MPAFGWPVATVKRQGKPSPARLKHDVEEGGRGRRGGCRRSGQNELQGGREQRGRREEGPPAEARLSTGCRLRPPWLARRRQVAQRVRGRFSGP